MSEQIQIKIKCQKCHEVLAPEASFCHGCGLKRGGASTCASCNTSLEADLSVCPNCGKARNGNQVGAGFMANADTSVTDGLTGLIWAPNGNLMATRDIGFVQDYVVYNGKVTWQHALDYVAKLNTERYLNHSDWRLPNINELGSLKRVSPLLPARWLNKQGFTNVQAQFYWSSTTNAGNNITLACCMSMGLFGIANFFRKTNKFHVWPVRSRQ